MTHEKQMPEPTIEDRIYEAEQKLSHEEFHEHGGRKYTHRHLYLGRQEWCELQAIRYLVEHQRWPFVPKAGESAQVYNLLVYVVSAPSHFFVAGSM